MTNDKIRKWDSMYLRWAFDLAETHSHDPKFKVGAILVNDTAGTVAGLGYNGRGRGRPNTRLSMETGKSGFIHAEVNAIAKASWQHGCAYTLYTTLAPCVECAGLILNTPIQRVVYGELYSGDMRGLEEILEGLGQDAVIMLGRPR